MGPRPCCGSCRSFYLEWEDHGTSAIAQLEEDPPGAIACSERRGPHKPDDTELTVQYPYHFG